MASSEIRITREELYRRVWERPVSVLAKEFGVSDVGLAKICRRMRVPLPGLGYWAKKQHGHPVSQPPLHPPSVNTERNVIIRSRTIDPADASQLQRLQEILDFEQLEANRATVPEELERPHPAVTRTLKVLGKQKPDANGTVSTTEATCLPVLVSPSQLNRALRIMDGLIKAFESREYSFSIGLGGAPNLTVTIAGEPVSLELHEDLTQTQRPMTARQQQDYEKFSIKPRPEYDAAPSGVLAVHAIAQAWDHTRKRWADTAKRPLELGLNSVLAGLAKVAFAARDERIERERRDRDLQEAARRRKELQVAQLREKARLEELHSEAASWRRAQDIRAYLAAVRERAIQNHGHIDAGSEMDIWLTWAAAQADRYDPLVKSPPSVLDERP